MPRYARPEGYSRRHRFAEAGAFGPLLRSGRKVRGDNLVLHVAPSSAGPSRLGIALTRRLVPSAVHRNSLKRIARELFRRHAVKAAGLDCVLVLKTRFRPAHAPLVRSEIAALLDRALPAA